MSATATPKPSSPHEESKTDVLSAYLINSDISVFEKLKIQTQVLVPVIRAFRAAMGEAQANQILRTALREWSTQLFHELGQQIDGSPKKKWATLNAAIAAKSADFLEYDVLRQDKEAFEVNMTTCRLAEFFKRLDEPELGALLACEADFDIEAVGNPEVKLTRTQTIMKGASHCDFRYHFKKGAERK
jgi:predicted ArsR family transcriptional regulator